MNPLKHPASREISSVLKYAYKTLSVTGESVRLEADLLLAHCLDVDRSFLYVNESEKLSTSLINKFIQLLQDRAIGKPIAYLVGKKEFWSLEFLVDESVLIPRPESELLVEVALEKLRASPSCLVLELGIGSGAVSAALASERPELKIIGSDIRDGTLRTAQKNLNRLLIENVYLMRGDWLSAIKTQSVDMIISNPPYISFLEKSLQKELSFEPEVSLFAKNQGLADIQNIVFEGFKRLKIKGHLIIEHGSRQGKTVRDFFEDAGFSEIQSYCDLSGCCRVTFGFKNRLVK